MIVAIIFAHVWGIVQLAVLGSLTRTTRVRTLVAGLMVGLYASGALALALQVWWTRSFTWASSMSVYNVVQFASYTLDPVIEEIVKVLPLAGLLTLTVVKRQWSLTDCVLLGAASGSGFGLAEALFRFGDSAARAVPIGGGWQAGLYVFSSASVPTIWNAMTSWLPAGVAVHGILDSGPETYELNLHLVYSAVGGLAVGLTMLSNRRLYKWLGAALLLYVSADHADFNGVVNNLSLARAISAPFNGLRPFLPIAALVLAWWFDRRPLSSGLPDYFLAPEQAVVPHVIGTLKSAVARPPWSLLWVDGLVRLRRSCLLACHRSSADPKELRELTLDLRGRINEVISKPRHRLAWPPQWTKALKDVVRLPQFFALIVVAAPCLLWFVVSSLPGMGWVQTALSRPWAWTAIRLLTLPALLWSAWQIIVGLRLLPRTIRGGVADVVAAMTLRLASGVGAVVLGAYTLFVAVTANGPDTGLISNFHIIEALGKAGNLGCLFIMLAGMALLMAGAGMFPPAALAGGGFLAALGITAADLALLADAIGIAAIAALGMAASTGGGGSHGGEGSGDQPSGDQPSGDQPGGDQPGGDQPSGDQPGGDQPGGDQPSGDQPDNLPKDPDDLLKNGWKEVTDPRNTSGSRDFVNPETGMKVRYDPGTPGEPSFGGKDHYHIENPNATGKGDYYLDKDGNPVPRGSKGSHILPGDK